MKRYELTHDQRKAAEAAFRGRPPDPRWSSGARCVYEGLVKAIPRASTPLLQELSREAPRGEVELMTPEHGWQVSHRDEVGLTPSASRDEGMEAEPLIDVSLQAHGLGLPFPVGLTTSLWDSAITVSGTVPEDERHNRVRELLMALQFHLSRFPLAASFAQFPVVLSFPPSLVPKLCAVCAVVHTEGPNQKAITLLLPRELPEHLPPFTG